MNKARKASERSPLSLFEIYTISSDVREGKANPGDARRLLEAFCDTVDNRRTLHPWLLQHLRDSFRSYLDNDRQSMESAFGLKRKKGRPTASEMKRIEIAADVLRLRLQGVRHQKALAQVAERRGHAESVIGVAFSAYRQSALILLRNERTNDFTKAEKAILQEIMPPQTISNTGKIEY